MTISAKNLQIKTKGKTYLPCFYVSNLTLNNDISESMVYSIKHYHKYWDVEKIGNNMASLDLRIFNYKYEYILHELQSRFLKLTANCSVGNFKNDDIKVILRLYVNPDFFRSVTEPYPPLEAFRIVETMLELQMHKHSEEAMDAFVTKYEAMKLLEG